MREQVLIIGVGNGDRGDDAVGMELARRLRADPPPGSRVLRQSGDGAALLEAWRGARAVIVLDAVVAGRVPGTVLRLDGRREPIPPSLFTSSTHMFGVAEAVELARALDELPAQLIIYGIQGSDFSPGAPLSPAIADAIAGALRRIRDEVAHLRTPPTQAVHASR